MNRSKHILLSTGLLLGIMFTGPMMNNITTITAMAAEQQSNLPYSRFWETQPDGSWKYKYDNGTYATGWILDEVDGNWYYMDNSGIMQSGLYKSYDRYYFFSEEHDGHFGHMLVNGEVYHGVTISADTSESYRGALSQETISQLGLDVTKAIDITGTQHVSGGEVVTPPQTPSTNTSTNTDDINQTGKITDPNDLEPGQLAIINGYVWGRDPSTGEVVNMGSTAGSTDGGTSIEIH